MIDREAQVLRTAVLRIRAGNIKAAKRILDEVIRKHPDSADTWYLLSYVASSRRQQLEYLEKTLQLDPLHREALARLMRQDPDLTVASMGEAYAKTSVPITIPSLQPLKASASRGRTITERMRWSILQLRLRLATTAFRMREAWKVFSGNRQAVFGLVLLAIFTLMAIGHPILLNTVWPKVIYDPKVGFDISAAPHPSLPSAAHLLGTDVLGRDVLSMLLATAPITFVVAITAALGTAFFSVLSGSFSAYFKGVLGTLFTQLSDLALLIPAPLVMIVIGFTTEISPLQFGLLYGLIEGLGGSGIVMRSQAVSILTKPYFDAARIAGAGHLRLIFKHLLPQMLPLAAVQMLMGVVGAIFADGFISFLGLSRGAKLNWGGIIFDSISNIGITGAIAWNALIPAALCISLFAGAFYFISIGFHEIAEPRLRGKL
ncbi:MAG: ABC transporter permease subunit [Chloroflexi bacterium]|nr:MAG: ABC transporter permease subunit [Chloroflexota bacterium]MBL1194678.1 ABC transporter permease subunit [Chloroflexota bacterium]NOH11969.1 ABC transporter permease subunit [Chloroflexota bacterium]